MHGVEPVHDVAVVSVAYSSVVDSGGLFPFRNSKCMLGSDHGVPKFRPSRSCAAPRPRACGRPGAAKSLEADTFDFFLLQAIEIAQNRQRNLWKSLERNSLDLERLGKKLGAVGMHYHKLYLSLNSLTCTDVSGRVGSERSIRNSLAVSSSSSVAYCALASEVPATTGP
jgi:hypothetical protein